MTETTTTDISPEGIVGNIAQAIVVHQLSPGTKPREEALAWVCNVSRTKVRVALSMLTKDELIRMELDRGVFVVKPDKTEAREVFIVRCMPEVALIRELITKTTSADCKRLEKYLAEEYKVAANDDLSDAPCRNRLMVDSHLPMADAVDNSMLREMPYGFSARSSAITMICQSTRNAVHLSDGHAASLEAAERGNAEDAIALMGEHMVHTEASSKLESSGSWVMDLVAILLV